MTAAIGLLERPGGVSNLVSRVEDILARDRLVLAAILAVAALLRLPGLEARAEFDGDQAHDMLVLLRFTHDGVVPLLGPPTSIGDFHHGAAYYFLLAPVAALTGSDPTAVVTAIALLGIAAVAATWWAARAMGGRVVACASGLLLAVSPAAVSESTFIWNPNPIPLFAAIAIGGAWRAWSGGPRAWWIVAVASAGMVVQLHVLGIIFLPAILGLGLAAIVRDRRILAGGARSTAAAIAIGLMVAGLLFVPLLVHELGSGFGETRHVVEYLTRPRAGGSSLGFGSAVAFTFVRIVGWPVVGLVTEAFAPAVIVAIATSTMVIVRLAGRGPQRSPARLPLVWLSATVLASALVLPIAAPSLLTVVAGLPNDHYHAFLDPVVAIVVGLVIAPVGRRVSGASDTAASAPSPQPSPTGPGRARAPWPSASWFAVIGYTALVALALGHQPPRSDPNGGWPAARASGARVAATAGDRTVGAAGVPDFKTPELALFPAAFAGATVDPTFSTSADTPDAWPAPPERSVLVVPCDRLFESYLGVSCGGPAEDARAAAVARASGGRPPLLVDRFDISAREAISVYRAP